MSLLELKPIAPQMLSTVLELDDLCFGGLWTLEGYQRELDSPNSELLGLFEGARSEEAGGLGVPSGDRGKRGQEAEYLTFHHPITPSPHHPITLLAMGCFWAILDEAHITLLAVHPRSQRQGLGQAMLLALLAAASDRGLERATLEVRQSNQSAISLYKKFGFKLAGQRRRYYKDTNEDALILWRGDLQQPEFQSSLADWYRTCRDRLSLSGWDFDIRNFF